jgi:hypothetical protein
MSRGRYEAGKSYLVTAFGLDVVEMPNALRDARFLYENPTARADDLMRAFADKSIAAIVASIGGDDAIRLMPHIDLGAIRDNPKILLGYSDPTVLHFGCPQHPPLKFNPPQRVQHGVTLIGRLFDEGTLGRVGVALEQEFNVASSRPPGF